MEVRPTAFLRREPDTAAMGLDDRSADGKTDAHSFFLRRHKRMEQPARDLRRQPRPGIRHHHFDTAVRVAQSPDFELSPGYLLHRFDAVAYKIDDHLLHLNLVDQHGRKTGSQFE